jgi:hypothetical protein
MGFLLVVFYLYFLSIKGKGGGQGWWARVRGVQDIILKAKWERYCS